MILKKVVPVFLLAVLISAPSFASNTDPIKDKNEKNYC